tara:strand:- start:193 stop:387 length:195 start_codon:yes stop_codon:yes gene_type:complete
MKDIRECMVWLEYTDGPSVQAEMELDIDGCIETQIRHMWEGRTGELANFKWDLCHRPPGIMFGY